MLTNKQISTCIEMASLAHDVDIPPYILIYSFPF